MYCDHLPWTPNEGLDGFPSSPGISIVGDQTHQLHNPLACGNDPPLVSPLEQEDSCDAIDMMWDSIFDGVDTRVAPVDLRFPGSGVDYNHRSPKPWEDPHFAQLFADSQPDHHELLRNHAIPSTSSPMIRDADALREASLPVTIRKGFDLVNASQPSLPHIPHKRRSRAKQDHSEAECRYRGILNDRIAQLRDLVTQIFRHECSPQPHPNHDGAFASKALVLSTATAQMRHFKTSNQDLLVSHGKLETRFRELERQALSIDP
jgi:hypothetical protein